MKLPAALAASLLAVPLAAQQDIENPKELGKVTWLRDYNRAVAQSKKVRKPILLFFQEVPG